MGRLYREYVAYWTLPSVRLGAEFGELHATCKKLFVRFEVAPTLILMKYSDQEKNNSKCIQARSQLGTPGGKEFSERGPNLCPIVLNYVQHIFPGGRKIF